MQQGGVLPLKEGARVFRRGHSRSVVRMDRAGIPFRVGFEVRLRVEKATSTNTLPPEKVSLHTTRAALRTRPSPTVTQSTSPIFGKYFSGQICEVVVAFEQSCAVGTHAQCDCVHTTGVARDERAQVIALPMNPPQL